LDHTYLKFGEGFEQQFLSQREDEDRPIEETLDLGWKVISILPSDELHRITEEELSKYYGK
jgi:V/A-type H+-transporting ATPase subunit B